jgi:hypothetical protein
MAAHPLESKWVFWYDNPKMKKPEESWEENLKRVNAFDSVEDFWCLFNNMCAPKKLSLGSNYHVFKHVRRYVERMSLSCLVSFVSRTSSQCGRILRTKPEVNGS